jgi:hypothetical protein
VVFAKGGGEVPAEGGDRIPDLPDNPIERLEQYFAEPADAIEGRYAAYFFPQAIFILDLQQIPDGFGEFAVIEDRILPDALPNDYRVDAGDILFGNYRVFRLEEPTDDSHQRRISAVGEFDGALFVYLFLTREQRTAMVSGAPKFLRLWDPSGNRGDEDRDPGLDISSLFAGDAPQWEIGERSAFKLGPVAFSDAVKAMESLPAYYQHFSTVLGFPVLSWPENDPMHGVGP